MATLNPYLTFQGTCAEAMAFYKEVFGGELFLMKAGDSPAKDQMPAKYHDQILHSSLQTDSFLLMATDMVPGGYIEGNTVTMNLVCKSDEEINSIFAKLSVGGTIREAVNQMFFGKMGFLTDKFGKAWMLVFENVPR